MLYLKNKKIGYFPNKLDLSTPGDRRRFVFYAKERGLKFELADPHQVYDVVYITSGCNCTEWIKYKKRNPQSFVVFELIDSYLLEKANLYNRLKGPVRYFAKKESKIYLDYRKAFLNLIKVADAVVCSTPIQKEFILRHNKNVHVSLDYFSNDIIHHKTNFQAGEKLKLVWEGQAYTVKNLLKINKTFKELKDDIELHIITDPVIRFPFGVFNKKTKDVIKGLQCNYVLHDWEKATFSKLIAECDLGLIPIEDRDNLMWNKPENKLLLLWEIGIPVFTSPTPAYKRVMFHAGVDGLCYSHVDWIRRIREFKAMSAEEKQEMSIRGTEYLEANHSKEAILKKWDAIFDSRSLQNSERVYNHHTNHAI